jgi:ribosome biogenesis GTPase / thiamine phosphate phosphatase
MKATVYKSTGSWYSIKDDAGKWWNARIRGVLKIDDHITSSNPVAVGDVVTVEVEDEAVSTAMITGITDRRNYINRQSPANKHQHHIVAANLDQSLLFATLRDPRTSLGFIDRFLVTSEAYHIPAIIVINKIDNHREKEKQHLARLKEIYETIGYRVMETSMANGSGVEDLKWVLKDKTTLFSGHSGVGKSTFINLLFPEAIQKTKEVSEWSGKGLHTTTFAEMFDLPFGGRVIDTPGLREFGLVNMKRAELSHYFPEMVKLIHECHFNDCLHMNEPGCAVKQATDAGIISEERFISYCGLLDAINDKNY